MKAMTILLAICGVLVIVALIALFYIFIAASIPNANLHIKSLKIGDATFSVEVANTTTTRMRGLSGRNPLKDGEGMLFVFDKPGNYSFWMKDMKFALDFVWIRGDRVVGITENVPPPAPNTSLFSLKNYYPPEDVDKVLELNAGEVKRYGVQAGQSAVLN